MSVAAQVRPMPRGRVAMYLVAIMGAAAIVLMMMDHAATDTALESLNFDTDANEFTPNEDFLESAAQVAAGGNTEVTKVDSSRQWASAAYEAAKLAKAAKKQKQQAKDQAKENKSKESSQKAAKAKAAKRNHEARKKLRAHAAKTTAKAVTVAMKNVLSGTSEKAAKAAIASAKQVVINDKKKHHAIEVAGKAEAKKKMKLQYLVDRLKSIRNQIRRVQSNAKMARLQAKMAAEVYAKKVERRVARIKVHFKHLRAKLALYHKLLNKTNNERAAISKMRKRLYQLQEAVHKAILDLSDEQHWIHSERCNKQDTRIREKRKRRRVRRKFQKKQDIIIRKKEKVQRWKDRPDVNGLDTLHSLQTTVKLNDKKIAVKKDALKAGIKHLKLVHTQNEKLQKIAHKRKRVLKVAKSAYRVMEKCEKRLIKLVKMKSHGAVKAEKRHGLKFMKKLLKVVNHKMSKAVVVAKKAAKKVGKKPVHKVLTGVHTSGVSHKNVAALMHQQFKQLRGKMNKIQKTSTHVPTGKHAGAVHTPTHLPHELTKKTSHSKSWFVYSKKQSKEKMHLHSSSVPGFFPDKPKVLAKTLPAAITTKPPKILNKTAKKSAKLIKKVKTAAKKENKTAKKMVKSAHKLKKMRHVKLLKRKTQHAAKEAKKDAKKDVAKKKPVTKVVHKAKEAVKKAVHRAKHAFNRAKTAKKVAAKKVKAAKKHPTKKTKKAAKKAKKKAKQAKKKAKTVVAKAKTVVKKAKIIVKVVKKAAKKAKAAKKKVKTAAKKVKKSKAKKAKSSKKVKKAKKDVKAAKKAVKKAKAAAKKEKAHPSSKNKKKAQRANKKAQKKVDKAKKAAKVARKKAAKAVKKHKKNIKAHLKNKKKHKAAKKSAKAAKKSVKVVSSSVSSTLDCSGEEDTSCGVDRMARHPETVKKKHKKKVATSYTNTKTFNAMSNKHLSSALKGVSKHYKHTMTKSKVVDQLLGRE